MSENIGFDFRAEIDEVKAELKAVKEALIGVAASVKASDKMSELELASLTATEYEYDCCDKGNGRRIKSKIEMRFHRKPRKRQVVLDVAPYIAIIAIALAFAVIIKGCGAYSSNARQRSSSACVQTSFSVQVDPVQAK